MNTIALAVFLGIVLAALLVGVFIFLSKKTSSVDSALLKQKDDAMSLLLQQMNDVRSVLDQKLGKVDDRLGASSQILNDSLSRQFGESQRLIRDITRELTEVKETGRQVQSVADEIKSLQDILKNPKQRGVLGEYYLETLLQNTLPGGYEMQYKFKDGEIVDAVVKVKGKLIPVDSKFSLENYNRFIEEKTTEGKDRMYKVFLNDLKLRIKETAKYIRPQENTLDFAFMFVPHEAIYYDLLVNKIGTGDEESQNLIQRAAGEYHVIIVSPTSFLAYLQTVLQGLKALQIEESAKQIAVKVGELARHLKTYEEYHGKLGNSLSTTVNHFNASTKEFKKIDKDVMRISGESVGIVAELLPRPETEE